MAGPALLYPLELKALELKAPEPKAPEPQNLSSYSTREQEIIKKEKGWFLNKEGYVHPPIITTTGQALLAQKHYKGDMSLANKRGRMILKAFGHHPEILFWFLTTMDSHTFFEKQKRLYNEDGTLKEIYRYPEGQARYAKKWHKGNMYSAYEEGILLLKVPKISLLFPDGKSFPNQLSLLLPVMKGNIFSNIQRAISAYSEKALFRHLGWTTAPIMYSARTWQKKRRLFVDRKGQVRPELKNMAGQIQYSKQHTKGSLRRAWETEQYVFGFPSVLNWQASFFVSATQAEEIINSFLDNNKHLKPQYKAEAGYMLYAIEHTNEDLNRAFKHFLYLPPHLQEALGWYAYAGSVKDRKRDQAFIKKNPNMAGLLKLARLYYKDHVIKAYRNALSFFKGDHKKLYEQTGYLPFLNYVENFRTVNTISFYERDKKNLIQENGLLNALYKGMEGYIRFAKEHYAGDMHTAYINVRAVLENRFSESGWILFPGTTTEFQEIAQIKLYENTMDTNVSNRWAEHFMKANNLVSYYKEDIEAKVQAFLKIKKADLCQNMAFL